MDLKKLAEETSLKLGHVPHPENEAQRFVTTTILEALERAQKESLAAKIELPSKKDFKYWAHNESDEAMNDEHLSYCYDWLRDNIRLAPSTTDSVTCPSCGLEMSYEAIAELKGVEPVSDEELQIIANQSCDHIPRIYDRDIEVGSHYFKLGYRAAEKKAKECTLEEAFQHWKRLEAAKRETL